MIRWMTFANNWTGRWILRGAWQRFRVLGFKTCHELILVINFIPKIRKLIRNQQLKLKQTTTIPKCQRSEAVLRSNCANGDTIGKIEQSWLFWGSKYWKSYRLKFNCSFQVFWFQAGASSYVVCPSTASDSNKDKLSLQTVSRLHLNLSKLGPSTILGKEFQSAISASTNDRFRISIPAFWIVSFREFRLVSLEIGWSTCLAVG